VCVTYGSWWIHQSIKFLKLGMHMRCLSSAINHHAHTSGRIL
jgi:hypothetical protein